MTTALFVFQACYGTPPGMYDRSLNFKVVSSETDEPIEGVQISFKEYEDENLDWIPIGVTNSDGEAYVTFVNWYKDSPKFRFKAEDEIFQVKDSVIADMTPRLVQIRLQKAE